MLKKITTIILILLISLTSYIETNDNNCIEINNFNKENQVISNTANNNVIEEENIALMNKYLEEKALTLKSSQAVDLYQMSCQYGFNIVKNAIELCYDNLIKLLETEKINIGGYIRSVIKNEFRALISKL